MNERLKLRIDFVALSGRIWVWPEEGRAAARDQSQSFTSSPVKVRNRRELPIPAEAHAPMDAVIAVASKPLRDALEPILDIGAETRLTTALIARNSKHAEIFD